MSTSDYPPAPGPGGSQYPAAPPPDPASGPPGQPQYPPQPGYAPPGYPQQPPYGPPGYPQQGPSYGAPYQYAPPYAAPQTGNGLAVAALVLGIISIVLSWVPFFDWVLAALAVIFGAVGISTANKRGGAGKGMAVAGLVMGLITIALGVLFVVVVFGFFGSVCSQPGVTCS